MLKTYPLLPPTSRIPFRLTNSSAFSENSTFEFSTRFCFNRFGVPLVSNPSLRCFLHTLCQRFCQTSEPCSNPMFFLLFNGQWREGAGGGGEGEETRVDLCLNTDFFTDKARPNYTFQPFTLQRKVHSRCWKSPLVKTKYTAGPHRRSNFAGAEILPDAEILTSALVLSYVIRCMNFTCPQQISAAIFHSNFPQKFSAEVFRSSFPQKFSAANFRLSFPPEF